MIKTLFGLFCNSVALNFLYLCYWITLVLAGVRCLLCNFSQLSGCTKPVTQRQNFPWSNPASDNFSDNSRSKLIIIVTCFDAACNWPVTHGSFSFNLSYWKQQHFGRPTTTPSFRTFLSVYLHLHVFKAFLFLHFYFWCAIFFLSTWSILAHVVLRKFSGSAYWYVMM